MIKFKIITPVYNSEKYISKCIESVLNQTISNWTMYIANDLSTDNTLNIIKNYNDSRIILIDNKIKHYSSGNHHQIIHKTEINDADICIDLDGDDWLAHNNVLKNIQDIYKSNNILMSHGSFIQCIGNKFLAGFNKQPENWNNLRNLLYTTTHLRTYYTGLFRKIKEQDLRDWNGNWFEAAGDTAFMYPMLEMAGKDRTYFCQDINYIYNTENPLNEHKDNFNRQIQNALYIKKMSKYDRI